MNETEHKPRQMKHHPLDLSHLLSGPIQPSTLAGIGFVICGAIFEIPLLIGAGLAAIGIKDGYME
jgi:hypothetical protein